MIGSLTFQSRVHVNRTRHSHGFTLIELLVVIAIVAILASLLLPAISKAKARGYSLASLNNTRQLALGWLLYADEFNGRLPYNLGGSGGRSAMTIRTNANWVNNVLTWELNPDNTNTLTLTEASLAPYVNRSASIYRCPSDRALSSIQRQAGWTGRVRSYSMNAMVGDAGELSSDGYNVNNPYYAQFFKLSSIPQPAEIFVFVEEHPDSINDGYFVNRAYNSEWLDLPASDHGGGAPFAFADGHSEMQRWTVPSTVRPPNPDAAELPIALAASERKDFDWVLQHMSIRR